METTEQLNTSRDRHKADVVARIDTHPWVVRIDKMVRDVAEAFDTAGDLRTTLRTLAEEMGTIILHEANPAFPPIMSAPEVASLKAIASTRELLSAMQDAATNYPFAAGRPADFGLWLTRVLGEVQRCIREAAIRLPPRSEHVTSITPHAIRRSLRLI